MAGYQRVVLVTGSNAGIGLEIVKLLATQGNIVYLTARNAAAGKEAQEKLNKEHGLNVKFVQLDITDIKSIQAAKDTIEKAEGRLDVLVNNAGISEMNKPQKATSVDLQVVRNTFEPNFFGLIQITTTLLPLIRKANKDHPAVICNVTIDMASNTLQAGPNHLPHWVAYNTSKAAANSYTIALADELKEEGIRVNCITPGHTVTKLNGFHPGGKTPEQAAEMIVPWCTMQPDDKRTGKFIYDKGELPW